MNHSSMKSPVRKAAAAAAALALIAAATAGADTYTNERGETIDCTPETVTTTHEKKGHPVLGTLAGAAVGGVVGHQVGGGRGQDVATVAGAGVGAAAGHKMSEGKTDTTSSTQTRCRPATH